MLQSGMNLVRCIENKQCEQIEQDFLHIPTRHRPGRLVITRKATLMRNGAAEGTAGLRPSTAQGRLRA